LVGLIVPLKLSEDELQIGDCAIHGEEPFALWNDEEISDNTKANSVFEEEDLSYIISSSLVDVQMVR
jgi:Amt family ammonium transporter